ncbi:MAG: PDZ domain-containing protein [Lachnospiraceae bacterium]|nr:PDZ domain-containing protein [Lachnospiraceae bacterium]
MEKKQENDDYSFMQEQIKKRPINKRRLVRRAFTTGALAIMFGVIASLVFILLEPALTKLVSPKEEKPTISLPDITLPEEVNEVLPEDMIQDQQELDEKDKPTDPVAPIMNITQKTDLEIDDYQKLYGKLSALAEETKEGMVTVNGYSSDVDWFSNVYEKKSSVSGLMVADNGTDVFIVTNYSYLSSATDIEVTFSTGEVCKATPVAHDKATNIMILTVPVRMAPRNADGEITYATLGNSNVGNHLGDVVLAVGDPMGYSGSVGYGIITSLGTAINTTDHNYKLITTDIYGSKNAEGYLINTKGQVIGIINQKYNNNDLGNQISAIGISELKHLIEDLSNGVERTSLGITMVEITPQAIDNGIPEGAFVKKVELDSPAMEVGIAAGDIIVALDGSKMGSAAEVEESLRKYKPDDEVPITLLRSSGEEYKEISVTVTLKLREE